MGDMGEVVDTEEGEVVAVSVINGNNHSLVDMVIHVNFLTAMLVVVAIATDAAVAVVVHEVMVAAEVLAAVVVAVFAMNFETMENASLVPPVDLVMMALMADEEVVQADGVKEDRVSAIPSEIMAHAAMLIIAAILTLLQMQNRELLPNKWIYEHNYIKLKNLMLDGTEFKISASKM